MGYAIDKDGNRYEEGKDYVITNGQANFNKPICLREIHYTVEHKPNRAERRRNKCK
jgi:hypothetical protein